jgi:spoIIIJ-associated protein
MPEDLEFRARTVDKAIEVACRELKLKPEELGHAIVTRGSRGIFGVLWARQAVIRVKQPANPTEGAIRAGGGDRGRSVNDISAMRRPQDSSAPGSAFAATVGQAVLRRILDAISPEAQFEVQSMGDGIKFRITGGESGILIGKRGQTLEAMQALVERAVNRVNGQRIFVLVDVEDYLVTKREGLIQDAERAAQRVRRQGRPLSLGYLSAQDRRTVHLALRGQEGLHTQSVGEGPLRKLLILPRPAKDSPA